MSAWSERRWLTWAPPVIIAVLVVAVLQLGGGEPAATPAPGASPDGADGGDERPTITATDSPNSETTPTTGFAERLPSLPDDPFDYTTELPPHVEEVVLASSVHRPLSELDSTPPDAPITDEGATLGRVLFYDVNLSANRTVRCASCHAQANSFTDPLVLSQGFAGVRTRRNSMQLANARFNATGRYLWDEAAPSLEIQMLMPFVDEAEMGLNEQALLARIAERPFYRDLFIDAFGDDALTIDRVTGALAQFVRAMVSVDSRYDQGRAEASSPLEPFDGFTDAENEGKALFFTEVADGGGSCSSCHTSEVQLNSPDGLENNGIDPPTDVFSPPDLGAFEVTGRPDDIGKFRVPSLRNIDVTGPFMHDGRLPTLEAVIDHYNSGIQAHENLSPRLKDGNGDPVRLGFDEGQKAALVAFLRTLTDDAFLTDPRFAEPFLPS